MRGGWKKVTGGSGNGEGEGIIIMFRPGQVYLLLVNQGPGMSSCTNGIRT